MHTYRLSTSDVRPYWVLLTLCDAVWSIHGLLNTWPNIAPARNRVGYVPRFECCKFLHYVCISSCSTIYMSYDMNTQRVRALRAPSIFDKTAKMTRSVWYNGMILLMVIRCYWTHISANFYEYPSSRCPDIHPRRIL